MLPATREEVEKMSHFHLLKQREVTQEKWLMKHCNGEQLTKFNNSNNSQPTNNSDNQNMWMLKNRGQTKRNCPNKKNLVMMKFPR